jgi:hypothetical protein
MCIERGEALSVVNDYKSSVYVVLPNVNDSPSPGGPNIRVTRDCNIQARVLTIRALHECLGNEPSFCERPHVRTRGSSAGKGFRALPAAGLGSERQPNVE